MKVQFSIIIPVYNVEQYLRKCLDSIMNQAFPDFEVICVNDGSTDSSLRILQEYQLKHSNLIIIDVENGGTATARNTGLNIAQGEYIWFIDSDDWIEKNSLLKLNKLIENKPDIVCFNGKLIYEETGREDFDKGIVDTGLSGWEFYNKYALKRRKFHFVCVVLRIYRKDLILQHNLFFEKGISHEDNLWIPQVMYYAKSVQSIADLLYVYRIRSGSKMQTLNPKKILDIVQVANKLAAFFIPLQGIDKHTVYREIAGEYFKGFMPEEKKKYGNNDKEVSKAINWKLYKHVSVYPRHKRIFYLLNVHPILFRIYLSTERLMKI